MKTVPKYMSAVIVRDWFEENIPKELYGDVSNHHMQLCRMAMKSVTAGIAGAVLTNPLDVIRNE